MKLTLSIVLCVITGIALIVVAYYQTPYWQSLQLNLGTGFLGTAVALVVVNRVLAREEKRHAALPLLKMTAPAISEFHNEHFIAPARMKFGMPGFHNLIEAYQSNGGKPEALSSTERDGLYEMIKERREKVLTLMTAIHDQLKEMTSLLGWSFSPNIITASLTARLDIVKFKNVVFDDSDTAKLRACEHYLDIDAALGAVVQELATLQGKSIKKKD